MNKQLSLALAAGFLLSTTLAGPSRANNCAAANPAPVECPATPSIIPTAGNTAGPLEPVANRPYFKTANETTDDYVYLTGSHTWNNFQDWGDCRSDFDFDLYLDVLASCGHNFIRLWAWEGPSIGADASFNPNFTPLPWERDDSKKKGELGPFDLNDVPVRINDDYFTRLNARVEAAADEGIYVSVMLFQGWSIRTKASGHAPWPSHPFKASNNNAGIAGDSSMNGQGDEIHTTPLDSSIDTLQKAYIDAVVDALDNDTNVLWEISNEDEHTSDGWQDAVVAYLQSVDPLDRPIGRTSYGSNQPNNDLFNSAADWISPSDHGSADYADDPPPHAGNKVVISDSDHIGGVLNGNEKIHRQWIWKSATRGLQTIVMDSFSHRFSHAFASVTNPNDSKWSKIRRYLGQARTYVERLDLSRATPLDAATCAEFCLGVADAGYPHTQYLIYSPSVEPGGHVGNTLLDVKLDEGYYVGEWFNTETGASASVALTLDGTTETLTKTYPDGVLYLERQVPPVKLVAHHVPQLGFPQTTEISETNDPPAFDFFFDPNRGKYEQRPDGPCPNAVKNPTYLEVSLDTTATIDACTIRTSWGPAGGVPCSQDVLDDLNAGDRLVVNTDDVLTSTTGSCEDLFPLQSHVLTDDDHFFQLDLDIDGDLVERRVAFSQTALVLHRFATEDVHVSQAQPNLNYGTDWLLHVRTNPAMVRYAFLKFNLPTMGGTATTASTQLQFSVSDGTASALDVHRLCTATPAWTEMQMVWTNWVSLTGGTCAVIGTVPSPGSGERIRVDLSTENQSNGLWHVGLANAAATPADLVLFSSESGGALLPKVVRTYQTQ